MFLEIVLATLALGAAGSAVVAWRRRRRHLATAPPALPAARRIGAGQLLPRDVVTHLDADYLVEGVATLAEGGRPVLVVATLTGDAGASYLVIDPLESPRCVLAEARDGESLGGAIPSWIADGSRELRLTRRASVRASLEGAEEGLPEPGACEYGVFQGPGDRKGFVLLDGGDAPLLLVGRAVAEAGLVLLPGGGAGER